VHVMCIILGVIYSTCLPGVPCPLDCSSFPGPGPKRVRESGAGKHDVVAPHPCQVRCQCAWVEHLIDSGTWYPLDATLSPVDPMEFTNQKSYPDRVRDAQKKTGVQGRHGQPEGHQGRGLGEDSNKVVRYIILCGVVDDDRGERG